MRTPRPSVLSAALLLFLSCSASYGQAPIEKVDLETIAKIKEEGLQRSKVMETLSYLTDVHGPRLTGSPLTKSAGTWTVNRLTEWGLSNAHLETWGPFGRGWTLEGFTANMVQPTFAPLIAYPKAWSPSTQKVIRGEPVYFDASTEKDLEKFRGKLHKAIVLLSPIRDVKAQFDPAARRQSDESLLALANAAPGSRAGPGAQGQPSSSSAQRPSGSPTAPANPPAANPPAAAAPANPGAAPAAPNAPAAPMPPTGPGQRGAITPEQRSALQIQSRKLQMIYDEGAAVVLEPGRGDGGTVFVGSANLPTRPGPQAAPADPAAAPAAPGTPNAPGAPGESPFSRGRSSPWTKTPQEIVPQVVMAVEHYNRIVRMVQKGVPVQLEIDIASRFYDDDLNSFNIIAEIPGSDLKDEVVMLGAHFDSWHAGTGATDNAVGCGVALEAVRILNAIGVKPRRTIRIGLWTGEEQGILGSKAYVEKHFGRQVPSRPTGLAGGPGTNPAAPPDAAKPGSSDAAQPEKKPSDAKADAPPAGNQTPPAGERREGRRERETPKYELKPDHGKLSAYFNLDNGTGKVRGVYLQGNEALRPVFRAWLAPFTDMGAATVSASNTSGTDHLSFDGVGLPGFQFIQDPLEYDSRTHHSSMDVYERIQEDDVKQASIIMASFVYLAAMRDEKLPRKPLVGEIVSPSTSADTK